MAKKALSERQENILHYIRDYMAENKRPPTIREIGSNCKISSTSVVNYNLNRLSERGYIERSAEVSRGLALTPKAIEIVGYIEEPKTFQVPLVGNIIAGEPIDLVSNDFTTYSDDDMIEVSANMISADPTQLFALRVSGDSMIDAMVSEDDIVIMRAQTTAKNGDMVAAWITPDDTTTLKYYFYENGQVRLQPANKTMDPIFVNPDRCQIQGKVEMVIRTL